MSKQQQIEGILNRLDAIEKQVEELATFAHQICQVQYQHDERLRKLELQNTTWHTKQEPRPHPPCDLPPLDIAEEVRP